MLRHLESKRRALKKEELTERNKVFALQTAIYFGYWAGLRISEITSLRIKDVWFEDNKLWLYIRKGKTHSARRRAFIEGQDEFFLVLKKYKAFMEKYFKPDDNFLMLLKKETVGFTGEPIPPSTLSHEFSETCSELGLGPLRFHLLRHAFASRLRKQQAGTMAMLKAMGHLLPEVTYNHYINNLDLLQKERLLQFWKESPLLQRVKLTPLLRTLGISRQGFYLWAKKNGKKPEFSALLDYLIR